jgi:hypothetical protein
MYIVQGSILLFEKCFLHYLQNNFHSPYTDFTQHHSNFPVLAGKNVKVTITSYRKFNKSKLDKQKTSASVP